MFNLTEYANLKYRAHYLQERGYVAEAEKAEAEAEAYFEAYMNKLDEQAGIVEG